MSDPRLPSDIDERAIDPPVCEQCQISENKIEDMQDALSDCLEFMVEYELDTRTRDFTTVEDVKWRKALLSCIERVKKMA